MPEGARLRLKNDVDILLRAREKACPDGEDRSDGGETHFELAALREAQDWLKDAGDPMGRSRK